MDAPEDRLEVGPVSFFFFMDDLVLQGRSGEAEQGLLVDGLGDVVEGAQPDGVGGGLDPRIAGDHDHRATQASRLDLAQDIDAGAVVQDDIGKDHIKVGFV